MSSFFLFNERQVLRILHDFYFLHCLRDFLIKISAAVGLDGEDAGLAGDDAEPEFQV